jgi:hypothetical protein
MSEENEDDLLGQPLEWDEVQYDKLSDAELDERLAALCKQVVEADSGIETAEKHLQEVQQAAQLKVSKAQRYAVPRYIEFGGALDELKARVKKAGGKWMEATKRFEASHETINLCQRFWKHRELLREKGALSLQDARDAINSFVNKKAVKEAQEKDQKAKERAKQKNGGRGKIRIDTNPPAGENAAEQLRGDVEVNESGETPEEEEEQNRTFDDLHSVVEKMTDETQQLFFAEFIEQHDEEWVAGCFYHWAPAGVLKFVGLLLADLKKRDVQVEEAVSTSLTGLVLSLETKPPIGANDENAAAA